MSKRSGGHMKHLKELVARDNMVCQLCEKKIKDYFEMSIDHILARALGGTDEISNLQLAHKKCNAQKHRKFESKLIRAAKEKK